MKKLMALFVGTALMAGVAQADLVLIDFDTTANWTMADSATTYGEKSYTESGWTFAADDSIRENLADRYIGEHGWRMKNADWLAQNTTEATYSGFSVQIRPWSTTEPSSSNPFTLQYSINSGSDWTTVATIGGVALEWATYGANFTEQTFSPSQFQVRVQTSSTATPRMNIDNFTAIPEPGTIALLAMGVMGILALRRKSIK